MAWGANMLHGLLLPCIQKKYGNTRWCLLNLKSVKSKVYCSDFLQISFMQIFCKTHCTKYVCYWSLQFLLKIFFSLVNTCRDTTKMYLGP
jgi:hypothetical protein